MTCENQNLDGEKNSKNLISLQSITLIDSSNAITQMQMPMPMPLHTPHLAFHVLADSGSMVPTFVGSAAK